MTGASPELKVYTFCGIVYPMSIYIKDEATSKAVRRLAKRDGTTLTDAIRKAVLRELGDEADADLAALKSLQAKFASYPSTGKKADKKFYDSLYEG
jgi:hypothetical protein